MFHRILKRIREKILKRQYIMTLHAEEEMNEDSLIIYDIEHAILSGEIVERQKDRDFADWKYRLTGETIKGNKIEIIVKLSLSGKPLIITVYRL